MTLQTKDRVGRSLVKCQEKHSNLHPGKDWVRSEWARKLRPEAAVFTVSHGCASVLMILRHKGPVQVVDKDVGVIEATQYLRKDLKGKLNLLPPDHMDVAVALDLMCEQLGVACLVGGAADLDFAFHVQNGQPILQRCLDVLRKHKAHTTVLFTFLNQRDSFKSTEERITWLKSKLPKDVKMVSYEQYQSNWTDRNVRRIRGSSMCIVTLKT